MNDRAALVASLPTGPRCPVAGTPARRLPSIRRTTSVDEAWDDFGRPRRLRVCGRDLLTTDEGTTLIHDAAEVSLVIDGDGDVGEVRADPPVPALSRLVGAGVRAGFRSAVADLLPDERDRHSILYQLLDDVPLVAVIASYGLTREHPEWNLPPEAAVRLRDICAGWADGATMMGTLGRTGIFPIPVGPTAPPLAGDDDALAWHEMGSRDRRTVRRARRLDLWRDEDGLELEVYFRDSHLGREGPEDVLHEYTVTASLEPSSDPVAVRIAGIEVVAHTLPWPECPGAVASAQRVVGRNVAELAGLVRDEFKGTPTCTHLNDVLRSIGGVGVMAAVLP